MVLPIEDYALLGDTQSAALVGKDGSIDWLALPRFDSPACFAALVGDRENGHWQIAPAGEVQDVRRRYRAGLVLETVFRTAEGEIAVIDFMSIRNRQPDLVRIVEGRSGTVAVRTDLRMRFDYGSIIPWVRTVAGRLTAVAGPEGLVLTSPVRLHGEGFCSVADFTISEGDRVPFQLQWHESHRRPPEPMDPDDACRETEQWWDDWLGSCTYAGSDGAAVRASLTVLKGLTYAPTGGIVAAPTTSLPERIGGGRNWDYRYCWLRDATFTLLALLEAGFTNEAHEWHDWLLRAVAGDPSKLQIMYGAAGERRLEEQELSWLAGYEGSQPVRIGNGAYDQHQLDVYGEVMDAMHQSRAAGLELDGDAWNLQRALMEFLESDWDEPDEGLWEVRGPQRHFTHSKVMAWVAADRAVRAIEEHGLDGPADRWRALREDIRRWVLDNCVDDDGVLVQRPDSDALDASVLMAPLVGFLAPDDPIVAATADAVADRLGEHGFIHRYQPDADLDGFDEGEGAFLLCSFWLVDVLSLLGRDDEARQRFDALLDLRNDVGLLSEQVDPPTRRLLGNFPQAFSHIAIVDSAANLSTEVVGPARTRGARLSGDGRST